jgi:hypothetical protein
VAAAFGLGGCVLTRMPSYMTQGGDPVCPTGGRLADRLTLALINRKAGRICHESMSSSGMMTTPTLG